MKCSNCNNTMNDYSSEGDTLLVCPVCYLTIENGIVTQRDKCMNCNKPAESGCLECADCLNDGEETKKQLEAIKKLCKQCSYKGDFDIKKCQFKECPLYNFRLG